MNKVTNERFNPVFARTFVEVDVKEPKMESLPLRLLNGDEIHMAIQAEIDPTVCERCKSFDHHDDIYGSKNRPITKARRSRSRRPNSRPRPDEEMVAEGLTLAERERALKKQMGDWEPTTEKERQLKMACSRSSRPIHMSMTVNNDGVEDRPEHCQARETVMARTVAEGSPDTLAETDRGAHTETGRQSKAAAGRGNRVKSGRENGALAGLGGTGRG